MTTTQPSGGRPSAVQPHVRLERRVPPFFATFCYGFLAAVAWVWLSVGARVDPLSLWTTPHWARDLAIGAGAGALLAVASWLCVRRVPAARELEREFGWILGEQRPWEIAYLALASGIAEEFLFRGALHEFIGPYLTTALFAAVHWPVNWSFRLWPLFALLAGALLAAERIWTNSLVAPAATHVVVNAINLARLSRRYRTWKE
jgi:membrane protease YdiL (CAAX protease family)